MEVIPAIDLKDGQCVRLTQGAFEKVDVYGDDAVAFGARWRSEGARMLHLVDLDGARLGTPQPCNLAVVAKVVAEVGLPVQFGGGVRTSEAIEDLLDLGVSRVVVGTAAATNGGFVRAAASAFGDRIVVGIDARQGRVALRGWTEQTDLPAPEFARDMERAGVRRIVFTDIGRDGTLEGPNLDALGAVAAAVGLPVVASGGVGSLDDLRALSRSACANVEAVIIGKALYTGAVQLGDAIVAAAGAARQAGTGG